MRSAIPATTVEIRIVYILVMGLTGAGKSTFVSVATENEDIPIGENGELDGVTQDVQDYVLDYRQGNIIYEIHLIDSPGFDDGTHVDAEVLSRIATFVNNTYMLKQTLAGVIYLHDITKARMGGVGQRNLRMLENMIGMDKWDNCTLVTTKWGCTTNPRGEEAAEKTLMREDRYFGAMLRHARQASVARFDPKSKGKALEIIKTHLDKSFAPQISMQMVDPHGPRLALGETDAGKVVAENLEKLHRATRQLAEVEAARNILAQKFDEKLFKEFMGKRDKLIRKHQLQKAGRWIGRTIIVGGTVAATVVTMGPGASIIALEAPFEVFAKSQKKGERQERDRLERDHKEESAASHALAGNDSTWLANRKVKRFEDLKSEGHSLKSQTSTDFSGDDPKDEIDVNVDD